MTSKYDTEHARKFIEYLKTIAWNKRKHGEHYTNGTAKDYARSIFILSKHWSQHETKITDLYLINDLEQLRKIACKYKKGGEHEEIGEERKGHGTYSAAITCFVEFREWETTRK